MKPLQSRLVQLVISIDPAILCYVDAHVYDILDTRDNYVTTL
jgi:hypothetical protein